ncbi:Asp-tRNA(Asn)/Glu-tRNA(Gln) amidotransferase subunit GatB [Candidatus Saccharibacteria bacterium]|nr:Asp-tRNA(Asn)/Glu-tRNA(Gln) amidotransferase subunit GatB [Candidatus Saccharibacteria bacterium]
MISEDIKKQYLATIGIECHVQLKTKTKLFAGESNDARSAEANTTVGHVSFGMPGALPVLNKAAVELAAKAAFALNTEPQKYSKFDRKHYFYPDLPKGYQISQFEEPIVLGGYIDIVVDGQSKRIGITRAHMEEDAGKSTHPTGKDYSLVDLNRAGTPLLEIVSEPDMHTAAEAKAFAKALYLQMKYADVSDVDLYHGNMRFDVNVSVSKDHSVLGIRSETKNINSFRAVEKSVEFEIERQIELLEKGGEVVQETRGWDDAKQKTISQRTKEDAHDYRYMPEPDVPPIVLTSEYIESLKASLPTMPDELRTKMSTIGLQESQVETLIDEPSIALFAVDLIENNAELAKTICNWLTGELVKLVSDDVCSWAQIINSKEQLVSLAQMTKENEINSTNAKELLPEIVIKHTDPKQLASDKNLIQVSDESAIEKIVAEVLGENQKAADEARNGELKVIGFLVGQVMAKSKGQANPGLAQKIIKQQLGL